MKKLMPGISGALAGAFMLGVFGIVISLSYRALGYVFPGDLFDQLIGLALFDVSALVWFMTFIYLCHSTAQYVVAFFGFLIGLLGVVGLVAIEVGISSGQVKVAEVMRPLTYVFIGAAVSHLVLIYLHHGAAPEVSNKINLGVEKAKIADEGMRQAEQALDNIRVQLGETIRARLLDEVLRDLNMTPKVVNSHLLPVDDSLYIPSNGWPVAEEKATPAPLSFKWPFVKWPWAQTVSSEKGRTQMWVENAKGERERLFCLKCKAEGKPWDTPPACRHILEAKGQPVNVKSSESVSSVAEGIREGYEVAPVATNAGPQPTGDVKPVTV